MGKKIRVSICRCTLINIKERKMFILALIYTFMSKQANTHNPEYECKKVNNLRIILSNSYLCFPEPGGVIQTKKRFNKQTIQIKGYFFVFCNYCTDETVCQQHIFCFLMCAALISQIFSLLLFFSFLYGRKRLIFLGCSQLQAALYFLLLLF